jgi:outer membrane protein OmpA-like peptidoglycan-associated protein
MHRWTITGAVICVLAVAGCATKKDLKLEMTRETVIHDPVISRMTMDPSGKLDTRDGGHTVTVRLEGDPGLEATFDIEGRFDGRSMQEVEPGVYQGTFTVPQGGTGNASAVGRLVHPPSGASQEYRMAGALTFRPSSPPPPKECTPEMARAFDRELRGLTSYFGFDKYELSDEAKAALAAGKDVLLARQLCTIFVLGHTDEAGEDEYNNRLSVKRAEAVEAYLNSLGISNARIVRRAYGESYPANEKARHRNRRVELRAFNPYGS